MTVELSEEAMEKLTRMAAEVAVALRDILKSAFVAGFEEGIAARPADENGELNAKPIPPEMYR